jgi:hypothetical protein
VAMTRGIRRVAEGVLSSISFVIRSQMWLSGAS